MVATHAAVALFDELRTGGSLGPGVPVGALELEFRAPLDEC